MPERKKEKKAFQEIRENIVFLSGVQSETPVLFIQKLTKS